ncbi:MAG: hypothetical protein AABZ31_04235, partial [Bdellovibrionota bacterium]
MKKSILVALSIVLFAGAASSQTPVPQQPMNPFTDGTGRQRLSVEERQTLLAYADNARNWLMAAKDQARGVTPEDKVDIYLQAIRRVVVESFKDKKRQELVLRQALNQALELTVGVPHWNGQLNPAAEVLKVPKSLGLIVMILEDSIDMALRYYSDDRLAIVQQDLTNLPLMSYANMRLPYLTKWNSAVLDMPTSHKFLMIGLQQWLNTAINPNNLLKVAFAEEITGIESALNQVEASPVQQYPQQLMQQVRFMRLKLTTLKR